MIFNGRVPTHSFHSHSLPSFSELIESVSLERSRGDRSHSGLINANQSQFTSSAIDSNALSAHHILHSAPATTFVELEVAPSTEPWIISHHHTRPELNSLPTISTAYTSNNSSPNAFMIHQIGRISPSSMSVSQIHEESSKRYKGREGHYIFCPHCPFTFRREQDYVRHQK